MTIDDRRTFLKKLARGVAYTAPVVASFTAPTELVGQGEASAHIPMASASPTQTGGTTQELGGPPPWREPPPGSGGGGRTEPPPRHR